MAPKDKLVGEAAELFSRLTKALADRTGEMSDEGLKSLQRLSPDEQVALDEFLTAGGKMGEVSGYGVNAKEGPIWPPPPRIIDAENAASYPYLGSDPGLYTSDYAIVENAKASSPGYLNPGERYVGEHRAAAVDAATMANRSITEATQRESGSASRWPNEWYRIENIPGLAAGAVGAGTVLAANQAEAAQPKVDMRKVGPVGLSKAAGAPRQTGPMSELQTAEAFANYHPASLVTGGMDQLDRLVVKPLMRNMQAMVQMGYFNRIEPQLQVELGLSPEAAKAASAGEKLAGGVGPGDVLRKQYPKTALVVERLFKHGIGPTGWNVGDPSLVTAAAETIKKGEKTWDPGNPEALDPEARDAIEAMGRDYGEAAAAGVLSMTSWYRDLPFFLMPAGGKSASSKMIWGGGAGALDPEGSIKYGAFGGAALHGAEKAVGAVKKVVQNQRTLAAMRKIAADGDPQASVVAVASGDSMPAMADGVLDEAFDATVPKTEGLAAKKRPLIIVQDPIDIERRAALIQNDKGVVEAVPYAGKAPSDVPVITTAGKRAQDEASIRWSNPTEDVDLVPDVPADEREGLVIVARKTKTGSELKVYPEGSQELQAEVMAMRQPVEVTLPDGSKKVGFVVSPEGEAIRVGGVSADEGIPNSLPEDAVVPLTNVRALSRRESAELARQQAEISAEVAIYDSIREQEARPTSDILRQAHAEAGTPLPEPSVIPTKALPPGYAIGEPRPPPNVPPDPGYIDVEFSVNNGGGVPPGGPRLPGYGNGPPDFNPKALPAEAGPSGKWTTQDSWLRSVWTQFATRGTKFVKDKLLHPVHTVPDELAESAMRYASLRVWEEVRITLYKSLLDAIPELRGKSVVDRDRLLVKINQFVNGTIDINGLQEFAPELGQTALRALEKRKNQLMANQMLLEELGMVSRGTNDPFDINNLSGALPLEAAAPEKRVIQELALRRSRVSDVGQKYYKQLMAAGLPTPSHIVLKDDGYFHYALPSGWTPTPQPAGPAPRPSMALPDEFYDWAPRTYFAWLLPEGEWAKSFKADTRRYNEVVGEMYKVVKRDNPTWDEAAWRGHAERLVDELIQGGYGSLAATASLRPRLTDMPLWVREALGEIDHGLIRMADAEARQQKLIQLGMIWKAVADNPTLSVHPSSFDVELHRRGWKKVQGDMFGLANNKMVRGDVFESLVVAPDVASNVQNWFTKAIKGMKWARTVGSLPTWSVNVLSNMQSMHLSNLLNPYSEPALSAWALDTALTDWRQHKIEPLLRSNVRANRVKRAMELGIVGSDVTTAMFRDGVDAWFREVRKLQNKATFYSVTANMAKEDVEKMSMLYAAIDPIAKYTTWVGGMKKAGVDGMLVDRAKAIKWLADQGQLTGLMKSLTPQKLERLKRGDYDAVLPNAKIRRMVEVEAAKLIHRSFPMVDRLGKWPAAIARSGYDVVATNQFWRTTSEMLRVWGTIPWRIKNEPKFLPLMLQHAAAIGGMGAAISYIRNLHGVDQEYVDSIWEAASPAQRKFRPGAMALWYRNQDGSMDFMDLTRFIEPLRWLVGSPDDSAAKRLALNIATTPVSGSPVHDAINSSLYQMGWMNDKPYITDPAEWERSPWYQAGGIAANAGLIPGTFSSTYRVLEKGGVGFEARTSRSMAGVEPPPGWMTAANVVLGPDTFMRIGTPKQVIRAKVAAKYELDLLIKQLRGLTAKTDGQFVATMGMPLDKADAIRRQVDAIQDKIAVVVARLEKLNKLGGGGGEDTYVPEDSAYAPEDTYAPGDSTYAPSEDTYVPQE